MQCCSSCSFGDSFAAYLAVPSSHCNPSPDPPSLSIFEPLFTSQLLCPPHSPSSTVSSSACSESHPSLPPLSTACPPLSAASAGDMSCFAVNAALPEALQMPFLHEMLDWGAGVSGLGRKRFTMSDLEELLEEDEPHGCPLSECEGSVSSKRLRGANGWVSAGSFTAPPQAAYSCSSPLEAETRAESSPSEGGKFEIVANAQEQNIANASFEDSESCLEDASILHCGDLDDILDILLQKTEPVSLEPSPTEFSSFGSTRMLSYGSESSQENPAILVKGPPVQFSNSAQRPGNCDLSFAARISPLQEREAFTKREQPQTVHDRTPRRSWDWQAPAREDPAKALAQTHPLPKCADSNYSSQEERPLKPSTLDLLHQSQLKPLGCKRESVQVWAGPTLLEIESALAHKDPSPLLYSPTSCNTIASSPLSLSLSECLEGETGRQNGASGVREDGACSGKFPSKEDQRYDSWRRLLKRGAGEPKYTLKLRCEEEAVNDGYRWRKYGQKTIKSSPYPRSYFRCTSSKCTAKKQVERSAEDPRLLLVTYEGIHLHPQPNPLANCMSSHVVEQDNILLPPMSSHLLEQENILLRRTCSLSPSSSSSCALTNLSSPDLKSDFGSLLHQCTSPSP